MIRLFFFQISAKNNDIGEHGKAVSLSVRTQEKGENNASLMCLTYTHTHTHTHTQSHACICTYFFRFFSKMPTDSLINGCAAEITQAIGNTSEVIGYVKPGSRLENIRNIAKNEIQELTKKDVVVLWGGTNDIARNESTKA
jgi:hypothetical protein